MRLIQQMPAGSACAFREDFYSLNHVQDNGGVVVAATVDRGINPTGISGRVTYNGTQALLINANKMTIRLRLRTPAVLNPGTVQVLGKTPSAFNDNQFSIQFNPNLLFIFFVAASAADVANYFMFNANLVVATTYVIHVVYDGTLAAASRVIGYQNGSAAAGSIGGVIPVAMRAGAQPVTVLNLAGGAAGAPANDFVLYDARLWASAFSAAESLADCQDRAYWTVP